MLTSTKKDSIVMSTISEKIEELKEDFSLFIEAGFVAVKQLDGFSASSIFLAAQMISPNSMAPQIGLGYIALNKLELKEATHIFEHVIEKEPENHLAQTFLGICYLLQKQKRKKGEKLITDAIEHSTDATIKNLGKISLEWAEKDLKKSKAPFFAPPLESKKKK
jgi:Tfp pilus assembly protein PilF